MACISVLFLQRPYRSLFLATLAVDFPKHDVNRSNDGHNIRHQMSAHHAVEGLQIYKRRRPYAHTIGLDRAVAHDVIAYFSLWGFNRMVDLTRRRLQNFSHLSEDRAGRNILDGLQANQARLPHLFHADQIAIVGVSGRADGNLKFVLIVGRVRRGFANVPFDATGSEHGPGYTEGDGVGSRQNPHALGTPDPNAILREQILVFDDARFEILAEPCDFLFESVVGFVLQAADAKRVGGQARPAVFLKNLQNFFAFAEAIKERRKRANIQSMGTEPQEVAGNSLQLRQDRSNHARSRRSFHDQQFFHCLAISQAAADGGNVVHAVDVGRKLLIGAVLRDFLDAPVQIPNDALGADYALAIELELDTQHAVGGRMLRSHVDDQFVRAQQRLGVVCGIDAQSRFPRAAKIALLTAFNSKIFAYPGGILLQDVVVLPQRIALPLVGQQNAFQIRVPRKNNSKHVKRFSLQPICGWPNADNTGHFFSIRGVHFQPQPLVFWEGVQIKNHVKPLLTIGQIDRCQIGEHVEFLFVAQVQRDLRQAGAVHSQNGLLAILGRFQQRSTEVGTKSLDQFIVERSLQHHRRLWGHGSRRFRRSGRRACASGLYRGRRDGGYVACGLIARRRLRRIWFLGLVSHGPWVRWAAPNRLPFIGSIKEAAENWTAAFLTHAGKLVNQNNLRAQWRNQGMQEILRLSPLKGTLFVQ